MSIYILHSFISSRIRINGELESERQNMIVLVMYVEIIM